MDEYLKSLGHFLKSAHTSMLFRSFNVPLLIAEIDQVHLPTRFQFALLYAWIARSA